MPTVKKAVSSLLCAALLASVPGSSGHGIFGRSLAHAAAHLAAQAMAPRQAALAPAPGADGPRAMLALEAAGAFRGPDDPLRSWMLDSGGRLTAVGEAVYEYYLKNPDVAREYASQLDGLRSMGRAGRKQLEAAVAGWRNFMSQYGGLSDADAEGSWALGARLNAMATGAAVGEHQARDLVPLEAAGGGHDFVGGRGVEVRTDKDGVVVYQLAVLKQQREMNRRRPSCSPWIGGMGMAPRVPETGAFNYEMLLNTFCAMGEQFRELDKLYHQNRLQRMARLLGKQYQDEQLLGDGGGLGKKGRLEAMIEDNRPVGGMFSGRTAGELADPHFKRRLELLAEAKKALLFYKSRMERLREARSVAFAELEAMQRNQGLVVKHVGLVVAETMRYQVVDLLEGLNFEVADPRGQMILRPIFDSPSSKDLNKLIDEAPWEEKRKLAYRKRSWELAMRLRHQLMAMHRIHDAMRDADYATGLGPSQVALQEAQKQLNALGADVQLYHALPYFAKLSRDMRGQMWGINASAAKLGNQFVSAVSGGEWGWRYGAARAYLDETLAPARRDAEGGRSPIPPSRWDLYDRAAEALGRDGFKAAGDLLIGADPRAVSTHGGATLDDLAGPTRLQKLQAALRKSQEYMEEISKQHRRVGIVVNTALWTVGLSLAGPAFGVALGVAARGVAAAGQGARAAVVGGSRMAGAGARGMRTAEALGRAVELPFKVTSKIIDHASNQFAGLRHDPRKITAATAPGRAAQAAGMRLAVSGVRTASWTAMSGGISGTFTGLTHVYDGGESPFSSLGEAFLMGAEMGGEWAVESWHPVLGIGVGLPHNAFEGMRVLSPLSQKLATEGAVGLGLSAVGKGLSVIGRGSKSLEKVGLAAMSETRRLGRLVGFFSFGDQMLKYTMVNMGAGYAAKQHSYWTNSVDGKNIERRILRAEAEGLAAMQDGVRLPLLGTRVQTWLLLPFYSRQVEAPMVASYMRSGQGVKDYLAKGLGFKLVQAGENGELPMIRAEKQPIMSRVRSFRWGGDSGETPQFVPTKDGVRKGIRQELELALSGKTHGEPIGEISPRRFLEVSQMDAGGNGASVGRRLSVTDMVRDVAYEMGQERMLARQELAGSVLAESSRGADVRGFGKVGLKEQEDVALMLYHAHEAGTARVDAALFARAKEILKPYLRTEERALDAAKALMKAVRGNKKPSERMGEFVSSLNEQARAFKDGVPKPGGGGAPRHYSELIADFKRQARELRSSGKLSAPEEAVAVKAMEYLQAVEARFNYFNKAGEAGPRMEGALKELLTEHGGNAGVAPKLRIILGKVEQWRRSEKDPDAAVAGPEARAGKSYGYGELKREIESLVDGWRAELSAKDFEVLNAAYREIDNGPWLLRNAKDRAIPGWRDEQFEILVQFFGSLMKSGSGAAEVIREFLLLKTGGGKTMLAIEGLSPLLEAEGRPTAFLTILSNLESQARMEFRAYRRLLSRLEFNTFESFKGDLAQAKLEGNARPQAKQLMLDEADAAGQQPILTTGEMTAVIARLHGSFKTFKDAAASIESKLGRGQNGTIEALKGSAEHREILREAEQAARQDLFALRHAEWNGLKKARAVRERIGQAKESGLTDAGTLGRWEKQARLLEEQAFKDRDELSGIGPRTAEIVKEAKPGWEARVRELLARRRELAERAVVRESPVYQVFGEMRARMYSYYHSLFRTALDESKGVRDSKIRAGKVLSNSGKRLVSGLESALERLKALESSPETQAARSMAEELLPRAREQRIAWKERGRRLAEGGDPRQEALYALKKGQLNQAVEKIKRREAELYGLENELQGAKQAGDAAKAQEIEGKIQASMELYRKESHEALGVRRVLRNVEEGRRGALRKAYEEAGIQYAEDAASWREKLAGLKSRPGAADPVVQAALESLSGELRAVAGRGAKSAEPGFWNIELKRLDMGPGNAVKALERKLDGTAGPVGLGIHYGLKWSGLQRLFSRVPALSNTRLAGGWLGERELGLTRVYAERLLGAVYGDPFIPHGQRWKLIEAVLPSTVLPRGLSGRGGSWMRDELIGMASGYGDDLNRVRMDHLSGKLDVVHLGQWFDSMDTLTTPSRRFWELENGADLTMPYEHRSKATMNDIVENRKVSVIMFSGTANPEFRGYTMKNGIVPLGSGSQGAKDAIFRIARGPAGMFQEIGAAVDGLGKALAREGRDPRGGLVVAAVPGTHELRAVRNYLLRTGKLAREEIAMAFSDAEKLRMDRGQAKVGLQMNFKGLDTGKVKVLLLDTRVAGRGLDLNFKGEVGNPSPRAFKGYTDMHMLLMDPQAMSSDLVIQAQGRIDLGRINPGTRRRFELVLDLRKAARDHVFRNMLEYDPFFQELRSDIGLLRSAYGPGSGGRTFSGGDPGADWEAMHGYIMRLAADRDPLKAAKGAALKAGYERVVRRYMEEKQGDVAQDQFQASGIGRSGPRRDQSDPMRRGLDVHRGIGVD